MAASIANGDLVVQRPEGLYCPPGDFYIDPWRPVARAVITHAHADHARIGHGHYLAAQPGEAGAAHAAGRHRPADPGLRRAHRPPRRDAVAASGRPRAGLGPGAPRARRAGLGGQRRLQGGARSRPARRSSRCAATCFITESTFGLPIYRWCPDAELFADINDWWARNVVAGRASVLTCYSFGKAQRILAASTRRSGRSSCTARWSR